MKCELCEKPRPWAWYAAVNPYSQAGWHPMALCSYCKPLLGGIGPQIRNPDKPTGAELNLIRVALRQMAGEFGV